MHITASIEQPTDTNRPYLVHLPDEPIDIVFPVAEITTLYEMLELPRAESASGVAELEGPEEVASLLEVGADSVNFMDEVFHTDHAVLTEVLLNHLVVSKGDSLLVDLAVSALVDELADGLEVGVSVCDEGFHDLQHLHSSLGQANEDAIVDLEKSKELEGLPLLGIDFVDTLDTDDEDELWLRRDKVFA
jgi:hypothetical protein